MGATFDDESEGGILSAFADSDRESRPPLSSPARLSVPVFIGGACTSAEIAITPSKLATAIFMISMAGHSFVLVGEGERGWRARRRRRARLASSPRVQPSPNCTMTDRSSCHSELGGVGSATPGGAAIAATVLTPAMAMELKIRFRNGYEMAVPPDGQAA